MDIKIVGTGSAVPEKVLTNDMLAEMVDTNDEWIRTRTGIRERRIVEGQTTRDLSREAAAAALDAANKAADITPEDIGVVICASLGTKDSYCPSLACNLQRDLGLREDIFAFDLNAACSGFIYALITASHLINTDKCALIVGCDVLSQFTDFADRGTCILFGDGAGAAVVAPNAETNGSDFHWVSEASGSDLLRVEDYVYMDGQGVFKFAVEAIVRTTRAVTDKAHVALEDIDLFICHQANERILKSAAKRLGVPVERFFMNLEKYGNTSAASIPLALDEAVTAGVVQPGAKVLISGFGGGMTAGAACFTWQ
jgi:3-oxoacyl-[acyl-carrier-protein] synthase-3